jgi:phosphoribosyl-AMP cyclohydrolase
MIDSMDGFSQNDLPDFRRGESGLLPAIAQDAKTNEILMMAWMNEESFRETMTTGYGTYFSRSRNRLWRKGEESGNRQKVIEVFLDCDRDTILLKVEQVGPACHEGYASCFFRKITNEGLVTVAQRMMAPEDIYSHARKES